MGPHHAVLPALAHVFYSMWSTNVVYAVLGFSAAALIQAELRDRGGACCEQAAKRFRIVGCLNRGRPPDKKDVWTVAKEREKDGDTQMSEEEQAVEPEVHHLARAIERLRFKIDALTLRRQAAALCPPALTALPPPPPPRIPSPPQSPISASRQALPAPSDTRPASP